jgi:hypothetical protein
MLSIKLENGFAKYDDQLQNSLIPEQGRGLSYELVMLPTSFFLNTNFNNQVYASGFSLATMMENISGGGLCEIPVICYSNSVYHQISDLHQIRAAINLGAVCIPAYIPSNQINSF